MLGKSVRGVLLPFLAFAASVLTCDRGTAENAPDIGIVGMTGGVLTIATVEPELDWPILLRRNDKRAGSKTLRIESSLLVGPGGKLQPLLIRKGGTDFSGDLNLDPRGQAQLQLAAHLPDQGDYTAELQLVMPDCKIETVQIKITRGVRDVTIVGATATGLSLETPDPKLDWLVTVRRNDNAANARQVGVTISGLIGPSGRAEGVKLRRGDADFDGKASLDPLSEAALRLTGELPEAGDYSGEIGLLVDGKRLAVPLKVKRVLKDSPIRVEDVSQVRATLGDIVPLRVRLQETEGIRFSVHRPSFMRLDLKDGTALTQATYQSVKVLMPDNSVAPEVITLAPNQLLDLKMEIAGLAEAGNYSGVVRVTADTRKLVDKSFEMGLRRDVWIAVVTILFGVLMSTLLRGWLNWGRPAVVLRGNAADLRERLNRYRNSQPVNADEREVFDRLGNAIDELTSPDARPATADIVRIRRKIELLPDWINLRRNLDTVQPPEIVAAVRNQYKAVGVVLGNPDATDAEIADAANTLRGSRASVTTAIRGHLLKIIDDFQAEITALPEPQKSAMLQSSTALAAVRAEVGADSFERAPAVIQQARKAYAALMIRTMQDMLKDPALAKPPGFTDQDWQKLVADLLQQLGSAAAAAPDAERQIQLWKAARVQWLRAVTQGLKKRIAEAKMRPIANDARASLNRATGELAAVDDKLNTGNIAEAQAAYQKAVEAFEAARTQDTQLSSGPAPAQPAAAGVGTSVPDDVAASAWQNVIAIVLGGVANARSIRLRLIAADVLLFVVLGALAVLVGLNFLYFDKPAWGSMTDIAVALLWGFGLHSLAGNAFKGIQTLVDQFSGAGG